MAVFLSGLALTTTTAPLVINLGDDDDNNDGDSGDRGDLVTLTSSAPRARLFVGVALILLWGEGGAPRCLALEHDYAGSLPAACLLL